MSNVIPFPVKNPRAAFILATGVTLHLPSEVKVELLAKALACLGLRIGSMDGGRLVARWDTYSNLVSDLDDGTAQ